MIAKEKFIVVAGATGQLGQRIVQKLLLQKANVRIFTRNNSDDALLKKLSSMGAVISVVDYDNPSSLRDGCIGATCIVSALSGVRDVIVDAQSKLLTAAVEASVPRFIPSDYCIDYRPLKPGRNRNLDLRKEFARIIDGAPLKATSILNGMFTDLLLGQAPVILSKQKRIFFWGNADQKMDFTTIDNTAEYTAATALDNQSPRFLSIAGDVASMRDIQKIASGVTGQEFKMLRPGGLAAFRLMIKVVKTFSPGKNEAFPAWQGMQYLHDMLSGVPKFNALYNDRYIAIRWTKINEVIKNIQYR
jgi:uncharacterized protein YbjT (DUF2867 family)